MENLIEALRLRGTQVQGRRGGGRRFVLARSNDIRAALQQGFTVKEIWRHLADKGDIRIQYDAFRVLVRKYVLSPSANGTRVGSQVNAETAKTAQGAESSAVIERSDGEPRQATGRPRKTFKWNPSPKIEDFV